MWRQRDKASPWERLRAPFVIGRFLSTPTFLYIGKAGLSLRTVVSVSLAFGSLVLFFIGPALPSDQAAFAAVASLGMALTGPLLAATSGLKTISSLVWILSVALAVISIAVAGASLAAIG